MRSALDDEEEPEELVTEQTADDLRSAIAFRSIGRAAHKAGYKLTTILTNNPSLDVDIEKGWRDAEAKRLAKRSAPQKTVPSKKGNTPTQAVATQGSLFAAPPKRKSFTPRKRYW